MADTMDRLKKLRALMLVKHPFFASLMMNMPMELTESIPTAMTDMKRICVNPTFIEGLSDKVVLFVLAHEVMHVALEHGIRRQSRDARLWNIACDYSINLTLRDSKFEIWDKALIDDEFLNDDKLPMSADTIYNMLLSESGGGGGGGGQPGVGEPGGQHYTPMLGDIQEPDEMGDPVAEDALRREIQQQVAQAAVAARMMGELSASLERFVKDVLEPKVPWQELLRQFMVQSTNPDQETWARRNRRYPIYLPSRTSEAMGPIIFIDDTSGSIGDEEIRQYNGEQADVAETVNPESIRIVYCDSSVKGEQFFERGEFDPLLIEPVGGGGTDMRVALEYVEQYDPAIVVLLTDGYTPWPADPPEYPLIVCCTTEAKVPVGEVVRI